MYKYRNVSKEHQHVVGLGIVPAGEECLTRRKIENPNFELIEETQEADDNSVNGVAERQPNAVIEDVKPLSQGSK